uniref:Integrase core domain containing protein n=1 Tax=Solanum tuberosum TaxID=4113 RepID=M1DS59_SOLTU
MTQEQPGKEREWDANIKKMLTQMELLQEHMREYVRKPKGISGVFRVEEGSSSSYSKSEENQGWNSKKYEGFYPRYLQVGGNKGWNYHKGEEQRRYYQDLAEQSDYWKREDNHEEDHTHSSESPKSKGSASSPQVRVEEVASNESEAETDEEQLGADEEATFEGLTEVEEAMIDSPVQFSLADTTIAGSSVATNVTSGTDTPTDRATV